MSGLIWTLSAVHWNNTYCSPWQECENASSSTASTINGTSESFGHGHANATASTANNASSECNCACASQNGSSTEGPAYRTTLSPFSPCMEIETGSTCGSIEITFSSATAECHSIPGNREQSLQNCIQEDCELPAHEVALLRDVVTTDSIIIEPDSCTMEQCEQMYLLRPGEWGACSALCMADSSQAPIKSRNMTCYAQERSSSYREVDMMLCDALGDMTQAKETTTTCNMLSCSRTPCTVRVYAESISCWHIWNKDISIGSILRHGRCSHVAIQKHIDLERKPDVQGDTS